MNCNWLVLVAVVLSTAVYSERCDEQDYLDKLLLTHVVFRHGARAPFHTYPGDPVTEKQWGTINNGLTQLGKKQVMELGLYLRHRYANFLPEVYNADDILVKSSDAERTIISGTLVMRGLYPPQKACGECQSDNWQIVPIHSLPEEYNFLIPPDMPPCPAFQTEQGNAKNSSEFQNFKRQTTELENFSRSASGASAELLADVFISKISYHGMPLPSWSRFIFPEPLSSYKAGTAFFNLGCTSRIRKMFVGKMVEEMLEHMVKKIERTLKPDRKLFVYSGHDANVLALLSAMNVWNGILPPFSSCVMVELWLSSKYKPIVTVSYKNDTSQPPHLLHLPGCRTVACSFQEFFTALASEVFDEGECYGESTKYQTPDLHLPVSRKWHTFH